MSRTSQHLTTEEEYSRLLDKYDTFLFDCDGVIWTGPKLVPGITKVLDLLRSRGPFLPRSSSVSCTDSSLSVGKNILFVTNNAKKSREMYKKAFDGFGIQASVVSLGVAPYIHTSTRADPLDRTKSSAQPTHPPSTSPRS
jgi:4-nitrophenyl phosphatase